MSYRIESARYLFNLFIRATGRDNSARSVAIHCIIALFVGIVPARVFARGSAGFVTVETARLEKAVKEAHPMASILERLSQPRSFNTWPADTDPALKIYVAGQWLNRRHLDEALPLLEATGPEGHGFGDLWRFYYATLLLEKGRSAEAAPVVEECAKGRPGDPDVLFLKSVYLAQMQNYVGATRTLSELIRRSPRDGRAYLQRALIYVVSFSHDLALKDLAKAARYLPEEDAYHRQMAHFQAGFLYLTALRKEEKAKIELRKGFALDPESPLANDVRVRLPAVISSGV